MGNRELQKKITKEYYKLAIKHFLYRHIRLDKNEPFYIGIGTKQSTYAAFKTEHKRAFEKERENDIWTKIVAKTDYEVEILLESDDYEFIKQKEKEFIKLYGRINLETGILSNLTDGGDGVVGIKHSEAMLAKMRVPKNKPAYNRKAVIDTLTLKTFDHSKEAAEVFSMKASSLKSMLNGSCKNSTTLLYLDDYKGETVQPEITGYNKKVIDLKTSKVYNSVRDCSKNVNVSPDRIYQIIKEDSKRFIYFDDYTLEKTLNFNDIKPYRKKVINNETGIVYQSISECARDLSINMDTLKHNLRKGKPSQPNITYYQENKN